MQESLWINIKQRNSTKYVGVIMVNIKQRNSTKYVGVIMDKHLNKEIVQNMQVSYG